MELPSAYTNYDCTITTQRIGRENSGTVDEAVADFVPDLEKEAQMFPNASYQDLSIEISPGGLRAVIAPKTPVQKALFAGRLLDRFEDLPVVKRAKQNGATTEVMHCVPKPGTSYSLGEFYKLRMMKRPAVENLTNDVHGVVAVPKKYFEKTTTYVHPPSQPAPKPTSRPPHPKVTVHVEVGVKFHVTNPESQ